MFNNAYYPNNVTGFVAPNRPQPRFTQPVTPEMSKMVLANDDELSVKISPTEKIKNMCTHKYPGTQTIALVESPDRDPLNHNDDNLVTCRVCGETFHMMMDTKVSDVEAVCEKFRDILQSAKTLYLDAPEEFTKEYFQILTLAKRLPQLFKKGSNCWASYEVSSNPVAMNNAMNSFQQVNGMVGGFNMGGITPMGAPMGYPAAPMAPQQQYTYNQYGQLVPMAPMTPMAPAPAAVAPNENPLMYQAPATPVAPAPVAPAPGVAPVAPVAPAPQPAAPAVQTGEIVQTKAFSV